MRKSHHKKNSAQHSSQLEETLWQLLWERHSQAGMASWKRLCKNYLASLLTVLVIGISLALPATLYLGLSNLKSVGSGFHDSAAISLYLKSTVTPAQTDALLRGFKENPNIAEVRYISPEQGMQSFSQTMGLTDMVGVLSNNPLPAVIVLTPSGQAAEPARVEGLVDELSRLPEVDTASLDMQWVKRLYAMIDVLHHLVFYLSLLLGVGVLLVIGNTIRLALQQHREELAVMKLIGATNAFARRPFLYTGLWYGLAGGLLAWLFVSLFFMGINGAVHDLAVSFGSAFHLMGLGFGGFISLLMIGALLGLFGSWIVVEQFINRVDQVG